MTRHFFRFFVAFFCPLNRVELNIKRIRKPKHRMRLIVDERFESLKVVQITKDSLGAIETHTQRAANREMFAPIYEICSYIRSMCFVKPADLQNQYWVKCDVNTTDELEKFFFNKRSTPDNIRDIYIALAVLCSTGGFVNYSDRAEFLNITVGVYVNIFDKIFDPVVLDGTAKINSLYKNERFNMIELPAIKTYKNTTINICKQLNGSQYEIDNHTSILSVVLEYIEKYKPQDEDALIITQKKFEDELLEMGLPPRTVIDHFGNITGTNKYANFKHLYIAGVPFLPDNAYKIVYHTYSGDIDINKEQGSVVINGSRKLVDDDYSETAASMVAAELVQAINRVRCRKWENGDTLKTCIFMLSKDADVISLIESCMDGVQITYDSEFYKMLPEDIQYKKPIHAIDAVLSVLNDHKNLFASNKVPKKKIFESHKVTKDLSDMTKSTMWKHPAIKQLVSDEKIKLHTRYVEFLV